MQQHDQITVFYILRKKKSKLFGQAVTRGPSVLTQGAFDSCSLGFFDRKGKTKGKLLAIVFSYMVMQDLDSIKWCSLINTRSTSFPWSCCIAKGWQQHPDTLSQQFPHIWRCHPLQLPCAHTASLSAFMSHISFTHPVFPELLMGFNLNS